MFLKTLLSGLTTIFAWTPASVLVVIAAYGLYAGVINIVDVHWSITLGLFLIGLGGIGGYMGITSVAWNLKVSAKWNSLLLALGVLTLTTVILIGATSESEALYIGLYWVDLYLFVCPLVLGFIHLVYQLKLWRSSSVVEDNQK